MLLLLPLFVGAAGALVCPQAIVVRNAGNVRLANLTLSGDGNCTHAADYVLSPGQALMCLVCVCMRCLLRGRACCEMRHCPRMHAGHWSKQAAWSF